MLPHFSFQLLNNLRDKCEGTREESMDKDQIIKMNSALHISTPAFGT